ncbi:four-carbon acid sugar kinase family protein [Acidaminococcus sp. NSJ-142]|uniref:four-carbon acid sugar kinase family protein n=1 Tax=Acidaminococcus TaxID=904 RepID=UPI001E3EBE1F|nr:MULTISPECIES: four-carbon acid sugar kinase family protein [Acidaminococcus]MCD2436493.1 four-carbon acid sugar kinase family protein [Acidaminococcus hominis]
MELLILADDLTGALDTGIQFVDEGANTRVVLDPQYPLEALDPQVQVLVIDTESRHIPPAQAADLVRSITEQAVALGVACIYKKTDSGLRGNVGAELGALLDASGSTQLHFIPAYPKTERTTVDGIHYIKGVPVADSVFGQDPFDPVKYSRVADVLHTQTDFTVHSVGLREMAGEQPGIQVYDAVTQEDILNRGLELKKLGRLKVLAGCAGFASVLARLMEITGKRPPLPKAEKAFLLVCGSVNPITRTQVKQAVDSGRMVYYPLKPAQSLTPGYFATTDGAVLLDDLAEQLKQGRQCLVDTNDIPGEEPVEAYAADRGLNLSDVRSRIPEDMGALIKGLLDRQVRTTLMVTGGDILMGFVQALGTYEITPIRELFTGTVLSTVQLDGKTQLLISKSGGFGDPDVILRLLDTLQTTTKEEK